MLEAVPNVSEGRSVTAIAAIGEALSVAAKLLDVHSDDDHHRSVFTLAGGASGLADALVTGIAAARDRIDLTRHEGVHPRVGAADVVPVVPLVPDELPAAAEVALEVAERAGTELGIPVFLYGEIGGGRRPAYFRRGGLDELGRRIESGELLPDHGPREIDPRTGVVLVGARNLLVAYNLVLHTADPAVAQEVALAVRESSGGLPGVQALGLRLPRSGRVQVSMNVIDLERTPLHEAVAAVRREAETRGAPVIAGELVGLVPARVLAAAQQTGVELDGVDETRVLERLIGI